MPSIDRYSSNQYAYDQRDKTAATERQRRQTLLDQQNGDAHQTSSADGPDERHYPGYNQTNH